MKMNAVFYLALMFGLATCAVVKTESKINEDDMFTAGTILRKIIEVLENDGTVKNSPFDIEFQNEKLGPNTNLTCPGMRCAWDHNTGGCVIYSSSGSSLKIAMKIDHPGMDFVLIYNNHAFARLHVRDGGYRTVHFILRGVSYFLQIREIRHTCCHVTVCFKITVVHGCHRFIYNFGCTSNVYSVTEGKSTEGVIGWNPNLKDCMKFKVVDSDKTESIEYLGEANENENPLKWNEDA